MRMKERCVQFDELKSMVLPVEVSHKLSTERRENSLKVKLWPRLVIFDLEKSRLFADNKLSGSDDTFNSEQINCQSYKTENIVKLEKI